MAVRIDFETFSEVDLPAVGAFRYAEDASTEALILSYSLGKGAPVVGVDLTRNPEKALRQLQPLFEAIGKGGSVSAHNSGFERNIWEKVCAARMGWPITPKPTQWDCTAARSAALSIPRSLEGGALALKLDVAKDPLGKSLMNKFSKPQKDGSRIRSVDEPGPFRKFIEYCEQDTVVEGELARVLPPLSDYERRVFQLDYKINDYGIPVDIPMIHRALAFVDEVSAGLNRRAKKLTGVKPSQRDKLLGWLQEAGTGMETLQAAEVERVLLDPGISRPIRGLLEARIELSRAGTKKLKTMLACASSDGRVRGSFWYHSATTGRWGSSGVQFHNLAKPEKEYPQDEILQLLEDGNLDLLYNRPLTAIAKSIRGFLAAPPGREFMIADYAAIEARGLAWLVDETFLLEQYLAGRDVYKAMAARIFGIRYEDVSDDQRFFGKQTILGAGYGMGVPKFIMTCARFGVKITEAQAKKAIYGYRDSVPKIVKGWKTIERAAIHAVLSGKSVSIFKNKITFYVDKLNNGFEVLYCVLPSGRRMCYPEPRVENLEKWGNITPTLIFKSYYRGMWVDEETYGGKLTENIIQALCRDLLAEGMIAVDDAQLQILLHVHDEIGAETDRGQISVRDFEQLVCEAEPWAKGLPIAAEGKALRRYAK